MSVLESIRSRFSRRQADAETQYGELVKAAAKGGDIDLNTLNGVLSLTDRSQEQFLADVEKIERRAAVPAKRERLKSLKAKHEVASRESATALAVIDEIRRKAEKAEADAMAVLNEKSSVRDSLSRQVSQLVEEINRDLHETCDPELQDEIDRLEARSRFLTSQHCDGRGSLNADPKEIAKAREAYNTETAAIHSRIEELRAAQVA